MSQSKAENAIHRPKSEKNGLSKGKRNDLICYIAFMAWPVFQFVIFYIAVNVNSFLLAFQKIDITTRPATVTWGLWNFEEVFKLLATDQMKMRVWCSVKSFLIMHCISVPLGLFFSYYIYKKMFAAGAFRVLLFMPSILSAVTTTVLFFQFTDKALPKLLTNVFHVENAVGLFSGTDKGKYAAVMFYNLWISFGTSVLMYSNKMISISPEISEAAKLDGASGIKEFWYVTLPLTYPTLSVFLITGVAAMFTNQYNVFSFYGWSEGAPINVQSVGFYLYLKAQGAKSKAEYPELAALGLVLTAIAVPMTLLVKWLLEKYGPSED